MAKAVTLHIVKFYKYDIETFILNEYKYINRALLNIVSINIYGAIIDLRNEVLI